MPRIAFLSRSFRRQQLEARGRTGKIRIWSLAGREVRAAHAQAIVAAEG